MPKSNYARNAYLKFEANAVALPSWGANLGAALHLSDPGVGSPYNTNVPTYTNYAPITVPRDGSGLVICDPTNPYAANAAGTAYKNAAQMTFPEADPGFAGPENITFVSIYDIGTGNILRVTNIPYTIIVGPRSIPLFPAGTLIWAEG
jgi:hypothetical protein